MGGFRDRVLQQADSIAKLYLEGVRLGQPATREQKEFIQGVIAADYDGRTVVELLQNGHDAHPVDRRDGRIEFLLAEDECEFGVLYVANGGQPVTPDDFDSMCRIAMSSKRPDQGIGNKGVGFKSVLQLSASPEVYSRATADSLAFDGFCFRFARPGDFDTLAARIDPNKPDLGEALRANVSSLKVTVPIDEIPARVAEFERDGFATVIRLALRSQTALQQARRQLTEITSSDVPFNLFLERVRLIAVRTRSAAGVEEARPLTRSSRQLAPAVEEVTVDGGTYLVLHRTVAEAEMIRVIRQSRLDDGLNAGWERWKGDATVCVAVPLLQPLERGRLYTFLPMGAAAPVLMPAFVNAPFFAQLDRQNLLTSVPLNDLLLTEVARLCAAAVADPSGLPGDVGLDLVCWTRTHLPRLRKAFDDIDVDLTRLPLVPVLGTDRGRAGLVDAKLWAGRGTVLTADAVAEAGSTPIVDPDLHTWRKSRTSAVARDLGIPLEPSATEIAGFAEAVAQVLASRPPVPETWANFYDDLEGERLDEKVVRTRRILIDDSGRLLAPNGEQSVFIRSADDKETAAPVPPPAVQTRLAFMLSGIPWLTAEGRQRRGRVWLESKNLVREYRTHTVLSLIGSAMKAIGPNEIDALRRCLEFASELWHRASREGSSAAIHEAALWVPTESGWRAANTATFGRGWGGPAAETDLRLTQLVAAARDASDEIRQLGNSTIEPAHLGDVALESWRSFLESVGVRHGISPKWIPANALVITGSQVASPATLGQLGSALVSTDDQRRWREVAAKWPRRGPLHHTVRYRPTTNVAFLPGQRDWGRFSARARQLYAELILRGLDSWSDAALQFSFARDGDHTRPVWPTFVTAFLAASDWIPQTTPGDRTQLILASPARAWWLRAAETPDYLPAPPQTLRVLATPRVLARLALIGVRFWDDRATARSRLDELTDLVARHRTPGSGSIPPSVRKAYEQAWEHLDPAAEPPHRIIVTRQAQLEVTNLNSKGDPVYVCDEAGVTQERLLGQTPSAMLAIRNRKLAARAHEQLQQLGPRRLVPTSAVTIDVIADGQPAADLTFQRLDELAGQWLHTLLLGTVEFQQNSFVNVSSQQLALADRRLGQTEIAAAESIVASVGGHPVGAGNAPRSFLLEADGKPRIIAASGTDRWMLLQAACGALAQLSGFPHIERSLELALIDLQRLCAGQTPTAADIAQALRVTTDDLRALVLDGPGHISDHSAVVAVLAVVNTDIAEQLRDRKAPFDGRDDLRAWLTDRGVDTDTILALADQDDPHITIEKLGINLATANAGYRALGLPALHNREGHARQFTAYLQQHRLHIQDQLRDRHLPVAERGAPLTEYLRLRDLPGLQPDPKWLDQFWDLTEPLLHKRVADWLDHVCPEILTSPAHLPSVQELREAGQRTAIRVTATLRLMVEAWTYRSSTHSTRRPGAPEIVAAAMETDGSMDFRRLTQSHVIMWLHAHHQWPETMPQQSSLLELTEQDLTNARQRLNQATEQQRQASVVTTYGTKKFGHDAEETQAFVDAVRAALPAEVLVTPAQPVSLPPAPPGNTGQHHSTSGGWSYTAMAPEVTSRVGLAGELLVGEWIEHQFGYPPETTWKSGYRRTQFPENGDDRLGYDFEVNLPEKRILIEVKATSDAIPQIALGESEVRRAQALAAGEEYLIAFVTNALDPARRRLYILQNPLAAGGFEFFRVAGRSMRLQFRLPAS